MVDVVLVAAGGVALLVAVVLRRLQRWSVPPPFLGLVTGVVLGPFALDVVSFAGDEDVRVMRLAARLLLAVALMAIALRYPVAHARRSVREVALLVVVVMPAMAAIVAGAAAWFLHLPVGVALVLGAALSPTDPVLASGIVTGEFAERDVPERPRRLLSLESGANDGLALPLVMIAVAWSLDLPFPMELGLAAYQLIGAVVYGVVLGTAAGAGMRWAEQHREINAPSRELYTLVLAALVLGINGVLNADGLLSVFVAGLAHNRVVTGADRQVEVGVDEALNHFLVIPVFVLLGAVLPWRAWGELGWSAVGFVLAVLLARRLPVIAALRRPLRIGWPEVTWLGWFGPIGVAAIFYLGHAHEQGVTHPTVWAAGTLVVSTSTVVHGLTAGPGRLAFRRVTASRPPRR